MEALGIREESLCFLSLCNDPNLGYPLSPYHGDGRPQIEPPNKTTKDTQSEEDVPFVFLAFPLLPPTPNVNGYSLKRFAYFYSIPVIQCITLLWTLGVTRKEYPY